MNVFKIKGHIRLLACFITSGTELRLRPVQDTHVSGPYFTSTHKSILIIFIRTNPFYLKPPEIGSPFSSQAVHLGPGKDLSESFELSCDGEIAHLQLNMPLSQLTSIWGFAGKMRRMDWD